MLPTERTKKWRRRSDARPAELVAAAQRCFSERGFAATRLEDVAARAGVSKATVYLYFESKEALFEAVVRAAVLPSLDQATALVDAFEGTTPDLIRAMLAVFEAAIDGPFPAIAKMVIAESGNFPELAKMWANVVLKRGFGLMQKIIERGVARGELREVDPSTVGPLIMAPVVLLGIWKESFGLHTDMHLDRHAILREHVETLMRGLLAEPPKKKAPRKARRS